MRHPGIRSVHIDYLGWLAFLNIFVTGSRGLDRLIAYTAWIFFGITYFLSGLRKAMVSPWQDGSAIFGVMQTDVSRWGDVPFVMMIFSWMSPLLSYSVMALELSAVLWLWTGAARKTFLKLSGIFHLGILVFLRIPDLTIGILVFHIFLLAAAQSLDGGRERIAIEV